MNDYISKLNESRLDAELDQFISGLPRSKRASNVYDIRCYDKEGNVTDHKFGINVLTNYGFQRLYTAQDSSTYVIFGTGIGTPSKTDQQLFEAIPNIRAMSQELFCEEGDSEFPRTFNRSVTLDSSTNSMICRKASSRITLDYNYTWLVQDWDITEFGEYTETKYINPDYYPADNYQLQTHCLVYDDQHQPSHFTKRMNEKVIITFYRANAFCFDIIESLYEQGKYLFINPLYFFRLAGSNFYAGGAGWSDYRRSSFIIKAFSIVNGRCVEEDTFPMYHSPVLTRRTQSSSNQGDYHWISKSFNWGFGHDDLISYYRFRTNYEDSQNWVTVNSSMCYPISHADGYRNDMIAKEKVMTDSVHHICGLGISRSFDVIANKNRDCEFFIEKFNLDTAEEMTNNFIYTDDWWHPRFSTCFGISQWFENINIFRNTFPVNDFHITSVKRYNYKTDAYDIIESFTDDPDYDFRNPERSIYGSMTTPKEYQTMLGGSYDVGININTDIAVLGFNDPQTYDIYLTDKYWDPTTFVKLDDNKVVPSALQHKKYFIKTPANYDVDAKAGFHTIREKNNHALVPSTAPSLMNTDPTPLLNTSKGSHHHYYASDEGWIFCDNVLIYPDSDDGTGHPYRYTMSIWNTGDSMGLEFSKNHIIKFKSEYFNFNMTDQTTVVLTIFNPDSTHPEIDPNTTAVEYYPSDLHFNANMNNIWIVNQMIFHVEQQKDILLIARGNLIRKIDMNNPTKNSDFLPVTTFTSLMNFVYDTDYLVYYANTSENAYKYIVYDYINDEVIDEIAIPIDGTGWTPWGCVGFDHTIYININCNGTYYLYMYDLNTESLISVPNKPWNYLINSSTSTGNGYEEFNHKVNSYDYDDETFITHCRTTRYNEDGNYGYRSLLLFKDNPTEIVYMDRDTNPTLVRNNQIGYPRLKKFNNGIDYVLLLTCNMNINVGDGETDSFVSTFILDLGYIKNRGYHTPKELHDHIYVMPYHGPTENSNMYGESGGTHMESQYYYDANNAWFGHMVFYKNTTITFNTFGPPIISPIEMCLPHQVTGTTKSINCYNSPKKINEIHRGIVINDIES